jgi:hypothetical protein
MLNIRFLILYVGIFIISPIISTGCPPAYRNTTSRMAWCQRKESLWNSGRAASVPVNLIFNLTRNDKNLDSEIRTFWIQCVCSCPYPPRECSVTWILSTSSKPWLIRKPVGYFWHYLRLYTTIHDHTKQLVKFSFYTVARRPVAR